MSNISPIGESLLMKLASTSLDPALPAEPPPLPPPAPVAYPSPPPAVPAPTNYPVSPSHAAASSPALLATPPSYQLSAAHSAVPALGPSGAAAHSSSQLASCRFIFPGTCFDSFNVLVEPFTLLFTVIATVCREKIPL